MKSEIEEIKQVFQQILMTFITLLKIMVPISIIVKLLQEFGAVNFIGTLLSPIMKLSGLPGEFGLVWATAMLTNIYGGLVVFFSFSQNHIYTIADVTVLATMILIAHTLPIELRIAQKSGVKLWYMCIFRITSAFFTGCVLHLLFSQLNIFSENNNLLWNPSHDSSGNSLLFWGFTQLKNYTMIFMIITTLMFVMYFLKKTGIINRLNNRFEPILKIMGMSKNVAPVTIIGITLGLSYGGALIINELKTNKFEKKDVFLSLSFMGLSHSLIEDTLLMMAIGASLVGILVGRLIVTLIIMIIVIKLINHISQEAFNRYFMI